MQYTLTGFTYDAGFRVFALERIGEDRGRLPYSAKADIALARKYAIRVRVGETCDTEGAGRAEED